MFEYAAQPVVHAIDDPSHLQSPAWSRAEPARDTPPARPSPAGTTEDDSAPNMPLRGAGLSALERIVIALSHRDPASSLERRRGLFARLFVARTGPPLADPRLEALRRYAILFRLQGSALAEIERERFCAAGYDMRQIDEVGRHIVSSRQGNRARRQRQANNASSNPTFRAVRFASAARSCLTSTPLSQPASTTFADQNQ